MTLNRERTSSLQLEHTTQLPEHQRITAALEALNLGETVQADDAGAYVDTETVRVRAVVCGRAIRYQVWARSVGTEHQARNVVQRIGANRCSFEGFLQPLNSVQPDSIAA